MRASRGPHVLLPSPTIHPLKHCCSLPRPLGPPEASIAMCETAVECFHGFDRETDDKDATAPPLVAQLMGLGGFGRKRATADMFHYAAKEQKVETAGMSGSESRP